MSIHLCDLEGQSGGGEGDASSVMWAGLQRRSLRRDTGKRRSIRDTKKPRRRRRRSGRESEKGAKRRKPLLSLPLQRCRKKSGCTGLRGVFDSVASVFILRLSVREERMRRRAEGLPVMFLEPEPEPEPQETYQRRSERARPPTAEELAAIEAKRIKQQQDREAAKVRKMIMAEEAAAERCNPNAICICLNAVG